MDGIQNMLLANEKANSELKTKIEDLEQLIRAKTK